MTLRLGATTFTVEFEERGDETGVLVKGQVSRFDVVDERTHQLRAANATFEVEGRQTITSPMPGKVVKIFVKAGDAVKEGQGLVVVEAMKMEFAVEAPRAIVVAEVRVKAGDRVDIGQVLVTFAEPGA